MQHQRPVVCWDERYSSLINWPRREQFNIFCDTIKINNVPFSTRRVRHNLSPCSLALWFDIEWHVKGHQALHYWKPLHRGEALSTNHNHFQHTISRCYLLLQDVKASISAIALHVVVVVVVTTTYWRRLWTPNVGSRAGVKLYPANPRQPGSSSHAGPRPTNWNRGPRIPESRLFAVVLPSIGLVFVAPNQRKVQLYADGHTSNHTMIWSSWRREWWSYGFIRRWVVEKADASN